MQTREVIRRLVREHPLLESLSDPERRFVEDIGVLATVETGDYFIREGEANPDLYLICTGSGELLKTPEAGDTPFAIGTFAAGDTLGELSFLDGMPRSASVRAAQPTEVVIIPRTAFDQNSPVATRVWMKLEHNLAVLTATRLKSTSRDYVKSLQTEVELLQEQVHFGTLFVYMIIVFGLNWILRDVIQNYIQELAARGIMQNTMQRFLRDEHGVRSVMVLSSTVASVCLGFFYLRHRNLIGVTIVHYIMGVTGRYLTMMASI